MIKFIKNLFLFILFSISFYVLVLPLWRTYTPGRLSPNINYKIGSRGHMYSRLQEIKKVNNIDILFLGSSHAYRGFDTRIFLKNGINTFNLGSSAQTPLQTIVLLKRYLDKVQPKLVIYEVYPITLTIDGVESSLDIIANDKNDIHSFNMTSQLRNLKTINTLIYALYRDVFDLNKKYIEPIIKENEIYVKGGYVESKIEYYSPKSFPYQELSLSQIKLNQFNEVIHEIKKRGIKIMLVYAPISRVEYSSYTNNNVFDSIMATYSEYYNFNKVLKLNDSLHFSDSHHLNQLGVNLFNDKLIEMLNKKKK
jgi:hypothetical protein